MPLATVKKPRAKAASETIPLINIKKQHLALHRELQAATNRVLSSAYFIRGPEHNAFAQEFARYCGTSACAPLANGSDAIYLALRALDIGEGDEVITTPMTFIATVEMVQRTGARVSLVDAREDTFCMDVSRIEAKINSRTRAIMPVHLFGHPAEMDGIRKLASKHGLKVIEDACQAHGAFYKGKRAGSLGDVAAFSFYPSKNLGGAGDGGACVSDNTDLIERIMRLGNHGCKVQYQHLEEGINSRLDDLQAAVLRVKLKYLDKWNAARRKLSAQYRKELSGIGDLRFQETAPGCEPVYHLFVIRTSQRDTLQAFLRERGILTQVHYPKPLHLYDCYKGWGLKAGSFPVAEKICSEVLSLPLYPELTAKEVSRVVSEVKAFFKN